MAEPDRARWNAKYREAAAPAVVSPAVAELAPWLPAQGRALDLAGGRGANAVWLARRGLDVTIVDISEVGLARAVEAALLAGVDLRVSALDLEVDPLPPGPWSLVLCSHYLQRDLLAPIARELAPGGRLLWVHPTTTNLERHPRPGARFLLSPGEAARRVVDVGLVVLWSEESWVGTDAAARHLARVVAERPLAP